MRPLALAVLLLLPAPVRAQEAALIEAFASGSETTDASEAGALVAKVRKLWKSGKKAELPAAVDQAYGGLVPKRDRDDVLERAKLTYGLSTPAQFFQAVERYARSPSLTPEQSKLVAARLAAMKNALGAMQETDGLSSTANADPAARAQALERFRRAGTAKGFKARDVPSQPLAYVSPDQGKPGLWSMLWSYTKTNVGLYFHKTTPAEAQKITELKGIIDSTPSGRALIESMGGWSEIEKQTHITFGPTSPGAIAQAQELPDRLQKKFGKRVAVVMGDGAFSSPPEAAAVTLGHELSHIRDHMRGSEGQGLQIPSEYGAHRQEIYIYEDLKRTLPRERLAVLEKDRDWQWCMFKADLWEDHIPQRYTPQTLAARYDAMSKVQKWAPQVYDDAKTGRVAPGSPHLDYHIFKDKEGGAYRRRTYETDIEELSPEEQTPELLAKREAMIRAQDAEDAAYRRAHGLELGR